MPSVSWMSPAVTLPSPSLSRRSTRGFESTDLSSDLLEVQHDVGHVLDDVGDGRELVQRALDLHRGDRRALQRRQQDAAQAVAQRRPEAALERLAGELAVGRR